VATFEIRQGRERVGEVEAHNEQEALMEYLRLAGCTPADVSRLGPGRAAWRGAVFAAVRVDVPATDDT
jgi:hypothetical protein